MPHLSWAHRSLTFLHDAARCLALVHQGQLLLSPSGGLGKSSLALLAQQTCPKPVPSPPRNEKASPYHSFLFRLLGHVGLIGAAGRRVLLSKTAYEWLDGPPELQLQQLRLAWFQAPEPGWYWLTGGSRRRDLDVQLRTVTQEAVQAVADLSTAAWVPVPELVTDLETHSAPDSGNVAYNLPRVRRATEQRTRRLLEFLLRDILPCLGLVELQAQEEIVSLRPTPEGASWLRTALSQYDHLAHLPDDTAVEIAVPSHELRFPPREDPPVTVDDDLRITVHLAAPAAYTFEIAHFAQLLAPPPIRPGTSRLRPEEASARYQLTQASLQQAMAWDYDAADVIFHLERFSGGRLPPAALAQLSTWEQETTRITCEPGYQLHTAAPAILDALRQRQPFRSRTSPFASGQDAWVGHAQAGPLFRYLRRRGYVLISLGHDDTGDDGPTTFAHRSTLPLPQLLVALRTYRHCSRTMPGLADLGLQDLERDLDAALPPDDRAAVQRLVESHVAILAEALEGQGEEGAEGQGSRGAKGQGSGGAGERGSRGTGGQGDKETRGGGEERAAALIDRIQEGIKTGVPLDMTYADTRARVTRRRVRPLRLESRWGQQYLVAHCELRQDERWFRLDRIVELEPTSLIRS
jgi:hypothetical protein